jgi:glycogen operon protein
VQKAKSDEAEREANRAEILGREDLSGARLDGADLCDLVLDQARLFQATLRGGKLQRVRLRGADLSSSDCRGASFRQADLTHAYLASADLRAADFADAVLWGADLRGADLTEAKLLHADLRGARYDDLTRWPVGFDLHAAGLVYAPDAATAVPIATVRPGRPYPLGATWDGVGVNFALYAEHATSVELCLFATPDADRATARLRLAEQTDGIWHLYVPNLAPGQLYGYRIHGPHRPESGLRFNANKLLVDPYAKSLSGKLIWDESVFGYRVSAAEGDLSFDERDSARFMPKSVVVDTSFPWGDDRHPRTPWHRSVVYEAHVKGFTKLHPGLPENVRGSYLALGSDTVIRYLKSLGVTALELMPIHEHVDDHFLEQRGLSNYWGYNTLNFFAPSTRFSVDKTPGAEVREFKTMVKALHAAGIEVILDVVYNHTAEGNHLGPTLSFRGIDNLRYYRTTPSDARYYMDYTGCGNTLNVLSPRTLQLMMDSLRYWIQEMHVDGFRFDLAAALMRGFHDADRLSSFFDVITQDPVISQCKLIAEPWDVGPGGYQVGKFPHLWSEWNGRYRDTVRRFWKGDEAQVGELASRLTGSSDLYEHNGRRPHASINFITAHDGFTLQDLVSYNHKHNEANGDDNGDGEHHNNSWNCGVEGPTDDRAVLALRARQRRNLMATLLLSQGVPMLLMGDERGRSQGGNNNAYCQDNETSWLDWSLDDDKKQMLEFTRLLVELRKQHPALRRRRFFFGQRVHGAEVRDILWLQPNGREMNDDEWRRGYVRCLGVLMNGEVMREWDEDGSLVYDQPLLLLLNAHHETIRFLIPESGRHRSWKRLLDTYDTSAGNGHVRVQAGKKYPLEGRSLVLLTASG